MFHLQTRIEFEKKEFVAGGVVKVLYGARPDVSNGLGQTLRRQLHFTKHLSGGYDRWPLLEDLLKPTLG